ncbi:probable cytochrome P450 49a1 [Macrobrachium nipponense]|uniref:probable cytochrome P450 49a1 n=1 Tax=Macrobrachium nipponense TaxID=159736 RepID=UPI0030C7FED1
MAFACRSRGLLPKVTATSARDGRFWGVASQFSQPSSFGSVRRQTTVSAAAEVQPSIGSEVKSINEIPGPMKFPIIGSLFPFHIYKAMDKRAMHKFWADIVKEYGPTVKMSVPGIPKLVGVTNPDDCETITRSTMDNPIRPALESLRLVRMKAVDNYFEKKSGLIVENGEEWRRVRTRVQTPMMKPKNVSAYLEEMDEVALDFMDRIAVFQEENGEMPEDFQVELYKWALESVSLVALGRRLGCLQPNLASDSEQMKLIHAANAIFEGMNDIEMSMKFWRLWETKEVRQLQKNHDEFLRIADKRIRETEAELLQKKSDDTSELKLMEELLLTEGLSRKDVVTLILDMLVAGIDTTSHTLGFTLYLLARNPQAQATLQEEIDRVLGDHKGPLLPKHLAQMSYLKAVVKESLRVFPLTLGLGRELTKDTVLSGYLIPKGYMVFTLNMFMAKDEKLFPRAEEFVPERWLRHKPLGPIHPYASLPFGTGTRMCIGRRIAEQEIYTFLTRAMQRYTVDYKYKDMDMITRLVFVPSEPLKFSFTERKRT